jgi:hypothetical protein
MPVLCIAAMWPIAQFLHAMPHAFVRTFYSADLLPLSSVLILGVVREIDVKSQFGSVTPAFEHAKHAALFFAIAFLMMYIVVKAFTLKIQIPDNAVLQVTPIAEVIAQFSLVIIVTSGAFCFWLKTLTLYAKQS